MPAGGRYKIVFYGKILEGLEDGAVKKRLAVLLEVDSKIIDRLFYKAPITIKNNVDYPTASKFREALRRAGIVCEIERTDSQAVDVKPPPLAPRHRVPASDKIPALRAYDCGGLPSLERQRNGV
jgi:hypothetical protein